MNKTKNIEEKLVLEPPETQYICAEHVLKVPISDSHFATPWDLRVYAAKLLEQEIGDEIQLTSMRVKKPHLLSRGVSRLLKKVPEARVYVTIKF